MANENSLWNEIKRLIALRKKNRALQSCSEIEFIKTGYPLVYKRKCDAQKITVIINPSCKEFLIDNINGIILYKVGNDAELIDEKCRGSGGTAVFIENTIC